MNHNKEMTKLSRNKDSTVERNFEDNFEEIHFLPGNKDRRGEGGLRTKGYSKKSYDDKPLISIITVVFNGEKYLEQTIQSVLSQTYTNVEYIIIDGGSTDGTVEIIKEHEDKIDYWVSEKDNGISDAFNKGILLASGEWIGIINADDWYEEDTLSCVACHTEADLVCGEMYFWKNVTEKSLSTINEEIKFKEMPVPHPSVFVKRKVYVELKGFNIDYKYAMDYEFLLRAYLRNMKFFYVYRVFSNMRAGGISQSVGFSAWKEVRTAKIENGLSIFTSYIYYYKKIGKKNTVQLLRRLHIYFLITKGKRFKSYLARSFYQK